MKKLLSLFLVLVMLFACTIPAMSLAEDEAALKAKEAEAVLTWMTQDVPEEDAEQILSWDKETVLAKLEGYDQPLEYNTKEEIADEFLAVTSVFSAMSEAAKDGKADGIFTLLGLGAVLTGNAGEDVSLGSILQDAVGGLFSDDGALSGLVSEEGGLGGLLSEEGLGGLLSGEGLAGLFSGEGLAGLFSMDDVDLGAYDHPLDGTEWENGEQHMEIVWQDGYYKVAVTDGETELSYLCESEEVEADDKLALRLTGIGTGVEEFDAEQPDQGKATFEWEYWHDDITKTAEDGEVTVFTRIWNEAYMTDGMDEGYSIVDLFDGTFWENGDTMLESWFQDGAYKVVVTEGEHEWVYLCEYDELEDGDTYYMRLISNSTGDLDLTETQDDHGVATFVMNDEGQLVWQKADGTEIAFDQIVDPLTLQTWYVDGKSLNIEWLGGTTYGVKINEWMEGNDWVYQCELDEDTDTLTGTGMKQQYGEDVYTDANVTFTFTEARNLLTWVDDKEEASAEGITFEMVNGALTEAFWTGEGVEEISSYFADGRYMISVVLEDGTRYAYVCTYDRATSTWTAVDPSTLDADEYADFEDYRSTATFESLEDDVIIWRDNSGVTGEEGIVLNAEY